MTTAAQMTGSAVPGGPCAWPALDAVEDSARRVRRAFADARHTAEDAAAEARLAVRRHPLASVVAGVATGALIGATVGLVTAFLVRAATWRRLD